MNRDQVMRSASLPLPLSSSSSLLSTSLLSPSSPSSITSRRRTKTTLNLRHRQVCENLLKSLPKDLESLWIGPSFVAAAEMTSDSTCTTTTTGSSLLKLLPPNLVHLDLDLTHVGGRTRSISEEEDFINILFTAHQSIEILSLRLYGNEGAIVLAKSLKHSLNFPFLETLDLRGNHIGDIGVEALSEALIERNNPNHHRKKNARKYCSLRNLILSWNDITCDSARTLASVLEYTNLERLDLSCNDLIGDDGVQTLCSSLRRNTTLRELNLFCCHRITDRGANALLDCLTTYNNTTLERVNLQPTSPSCRTFEKVEYWLALNRGGRRILRHKETFPVGLWSYILAKKTSPSTLCHTCTEAGGGPSELYFLLCENPQLFE